MQFYFDYISHNAYLAWIQIAGLAEDHDRTLELVPVLFAGSLGAHGQRGPAEIPPKRDWMLRDVARRAGLLDVPLAPPASHPFNPLLALRVSSLCVHPALLMQLVDRLFLVVWPRAGA